MMDDDLKKQVAWAALEHVHDARVVGVGTGSTVNYFIEALATLKGHLDAVVPSSKATELLLRAQGLPVVDLNGVDGVEIYVDGADEVNPLRQLIKGGGGALTQEKIIASASHRFVCIVHESKLVRHLGAFPLAVEVIPMARGFVARALVALGGSPHYRQGFVTDNGNIILDVLDLPLETMLDLEYHLNNIPGVVEHGFFSKRLPDEVLVAGSMGVQCLSQLVGTKL